MGGYVLGLAAKHRLALTISIVLVVSFLAVSLVNYRYTGNSARTELLTSTLPLTSDTIYSEIQTDLIRPIYVSSLMANDTFLKDWATDGEHDLEKIRRYLQEIKTKYGFFTSFFISSRTMKYYYFDGVLKTVTPADEHDIWYYNFIGSKKKWDLDVDTNEAAHNTLTIFINHRLQSSTGELLGVTGVGLEMSIVSEMVARYREKYKRNVYFVDENGLMQVNADDTLVKKVNIREMDGISVVADKILATRVGNTDAVYTRNGESFFVAARYIPEFQWVMLVEQPETAALEVARKNLVNTLLVGLLTSCLVIAICMAAVNVFHKRMERLATTDELTGLANRREFERLFLRAEARQRRHAGNLSLVMLDVDSFKKINDACGHLTGDNVLRTVSDAILKSVRVEDLVVRWGGDEFLVLAECESERACEMAERIRVAVGGMNLEILRACMPPLSLSVSVGVAEYVPGEGLDSFLGRADAAMYAAKGA